MTDTPPPGRSLWTWILAGVGLLVVALIGGGWFMLRKASGFIDEQVGQIAVVQEQIGTVRHLTVDAKATAEGGEPGRMIFSIEGSKATGRLTIQLDTARAPTHLIRGGTLVLSDGRSFPVPPSIPVGPAAPAPATTPGPPAAPAAPATADSAPKP